MEPSSHADLLGAERPFFAMRESLDDAQSMSSVSFARGDLSMGRYRRDRPGFGLSTPNPPSPMFMAVVILRPRRAHAGWRDERALDLPALGRGSLACLDLRESWTMDLADPFDSFHIFVPQTAFDDIASEHRLPRVEGLDCPPTAACRDETMLNLARSLGPALARPREANLLFADHVFSAMTIHLASTYGRLAGGDPGPWGGEPARGLSPRQLRCVVELLNADVANDLGLSDLALQCGMSRSAFARAFRQTTGLPPHRWLLLSRAKRARELLERTRLPISEIALECGFADQSHLTRVFSKTFQVSPGAYRRQRRD
jgi:AraC family transcriptional regulator